ncbi:MULTISPECIES: RagB/SusD family nutrient uptake outer membrane protein [unclassified Spirosoma]|uniref:RagB/SusD family nutrient uptake outer membrane protein n=1 Tax=unclassified Spirosoma TaxID=2621999 RepID=UPI000967076D|nr:MULTISPECIES: RagB/SusD family nutrient uptake outer membrane protein [unclassified Spirosoma]MBN8826543.1 RagB/SusD family nutrient uptake outer membrane protein [Spirosoma sp.]OJW71603.1 MAG: RagB/SusD family nutrient uptake outer membrane protein [Spirosoma sp. 48-14]
MKKLLIYSLTLLMGMNLVMSCKEDEFLKEEPLDFYSPDNSLETSAQFQLSINYLHNRLRNIAFGGIDLDSYFALRYATDFAVNATDYQPAVKLNDYKNTMVPTYNVPQVIWQNVYQIIANANVVINRAKLSTKLSDADKNLFKAQGLFFRAWGYNMLANLYGGVPLVTEEISVPRRDLVRATRDQVYTQCKTDLIEAITSLPNIDAVKDGAVNKQVAQHILSEVYISLKAYDDAITTATQVINYPGVGLMTTRFGARKANPGDVYRDLFELGNQNRTSGNREGLYVIQSDYLNLASTQRDAMQWAVMSGIQNVTIKSSVDGKTVVAVKGPNEKWSGRGVGWIRPTSFVLYGMWNSGKDDIRNSEYNIIRDFQIDGVPTTSPDYGKWYVKDGYKAKATGFIDTIRYWYPILKKNTISAGDFPDAYFQRDAAGNVLSSPLGGRLLINGSDLFRDNYLIRLPETYFLRAEAYIMKGNMASAADDLNIVRARAKATPITAADVTIDFLLDERMRELYGEEFRMVTLTRMGKLYDRNKKYNEKAGLSIEPYHNLWPIPFSEINRNVFATLEQNPGYN